MGTMRPAEFQDEFKVMNLPLQHFWVQPERVLRGSIFVFDAASCPDSYYSSANSFSCLIYLYVCAPLVVQLHLLSLIGSSHDNHRGHLRLNNLLDDGMCCGRYPAVLPGGTLS